VRPAFLDEPTGNAVRQRVAALEQATGVEVVTAVIARADSYPEAPWKAFALGASVASLAAAAAAFFEPGWEASAAVAEAAVIALAVGAVCAFGTIWIAPFARLFVPRSRREGEVLQYAQALFVKSGVSATRRRNGVLLLVSLFERQVAVVADSGMRDRIDATGFEPVVAAMTGRLAGGPLQDALLDGLAKLQETLTARGFRAAPERANELPDSVLQQRGPA
jgi:putative membrane protein